MISRHLAKDNRSAFFFLIRANVLLLYRYGRTDIELRIYREARNVSFVALAFVHSKNACSRSFWRSKQRIQAINRLLSEGGCRFTRSRKHNSCQLDRSQKERCLRFIQEKVQSCTRLYGDKDSVRTNDTSGTIYNSNEVIRNRPEDWPIK